MAPNLFQLEQECFVVLNMSELVWVLVVLFQIPIRRRRDDKMDRSIIQVREFPRIAVDQSVNSSCHNFTQRRPSGQ